MSSEPTSRALSTETRSLPQILNQVEAAVVDMECELLDQLTPEQFGIVLDLCKATRLMTVTELALLDRAA